MTTTQETTIETPIDPAKIEQFAGKMMGAMNGAGLVFLASIGRHTGLFDKLSDLPPSTSERTLRRINDVLCDRFHISHTTVQFEHVNCAVSESGCVIPVDVSEGHSGAHRH